MERVRRVGGPLAVLVALVVLAGACGGGGEDGGGQAAETAVEAADVVIAPDGPPRRGGSVVYALASETDGWDPTVNRWATDGTQVALTFFDPLAAYNADGEAVPYLAESITPNGDFTEWTITLRPGIRFHDGTELNAAAVKTMFDAREKSVLTGPALALIETVETTGDLSLVVRMNGPWAAFPVALTGQAGVVPAPSQLASPDSSRKPIGTGPFRFVEWVPDNRLVVERNPDYWLRDEAGNQMPYLDRIEFRPIPDDTARSAAVTTGDVDIAHTGAVSSIKQFRELAAAGKLQYVEQRGDTEVTFVQLNLATPPFDDLRARRAVALATDNQALGGRDRPGGHDPGHQRVPPELQVVRGRRVPRLRPRRRHGGGRRLRGRHRSAPHLHPLGDRHAARPPAGRVPQADVGAGRHAGRGPTGRRRHAHRRRRPRQLPSDHVVAVRVPRPRLRTGLVGSRQRPAGG